MDGTIVATAQSDRDALKALQAGDRGAFERIYARHATPLLTYLVGMVGDRDQAEELLQNVFIGFARRASSLRAGTDVRAYLFASARNAVINLYRGRTRRVRFEKDYELFVRRRADAPDDGLSHLEQEELRARLNRAVAGLPAPQTEVVLLRLHGELTFKQIARLTAAPQGTVATRYRTAIRTLREALGDE
jgi:RNA polymerase sigma-70 factor (ECF subfamily)